MRMLPSADVAISTARRRLSCKTGRSAAQSETAAKITAAIRKLDILDSWRNGRSESRCRKTDQTPECAFHIGCFAEASVQRLQILAARTERMTHGAGHEEHPPEHFDMGNSGTAA